MDATALNESRFPGNLAAFSELVSSLTANRVIAFTGAGTSTPEIPTWGGILSDLLSVAQTTGMLLDQDLKALSSLIDSDPLEVAESIEDTLTKPIFRSKLANVFSRHVCTNLHELLVDIPFKAFITVNYDAGLSTAYAKSKRELPRIVRADEQYELSQWTKGELSYTGNGLILHWHGVPSSPDTMVFTSSDYHRFYGDSKNSKFIQDIWSRERILVIGFGFRDPFLIRALEHVLRDQTSDNHHFALIGWRDSAPPTPLMRRTFAKKYRMSPIFYDVSIDEHGREDHSALSTILVQISGALKQPSDVAIPPLCPTPNIPNSGVEDSTTVFRKGLFTSPSGNTLYVEPLLTSPEFATAESLESGGDQISVEEIVRSSDSYVISAPHEHGLSSLGMRLENDILATGFQAHLRDATALPRYRAKLLSDPAFKAGASPDGATLILDNFNGEKHERLLKEIQDIGVFSRFIFLVTRQMSMNFDDSLPHTTSHKSATLLPVQRAGIRVLAAQLYGKSDQDLISAVVEKTYDDLLDLCIPLTPANVIMYISILHSNGDFLPLSRLQIIDRYVRNLLVRPSDSYRESFNVENKLDIISAFVVELYNQDRIQFSEPDWFDFCKRYMNKMLISFDARSLFIDLSLSRVLYSVGDNYIFGYRLYYSYFLGRFIVNRPLDLAVFIAENRHMRLDGLVEVISGLSSDNTVLVTDLVEKLETANIAFATQYGIKDFDPYQGLEWVKSDIEDSAVWEPVNRQLESGPDSSERVDEVKRSLSAERRTENQAVVIQEFDKLERNVSYNQSALIAAINNAIEIEGSLKVRAVNAIIESYKIALQIGFIFSSIIANRRFFVWNGIAFENLIEFREEDRDDLDRRTRIVAAAIPRAVAERAANEMGSKKLSEVYGHIVRTADVSEFQDLINLSLIIRSKPNEWEELSGAIITKTGRKALYLRYMLSMSMNQFRNEVNTNSERVSLKRIVAHIRAKRDFNKSSVGAGAITATLRKLEKISFFKHPTDVGEK